MKHYWSTWKGIVAGAVQEAFPDADPQQVEQALSVETPPDTGKGDIAFPMFPFAKVLRANPQAIAQAVAMEVEKAQVGRDIPGGRAEALGPYVNIFLDRPSVGAQVVNDVLSSLGAYGNSDALEGQRITIEFSCPNTNKPLHLGHLRNDALGESVARLLRAAGATVRRVNLINDRGIHICKSMLAYQEFGEGATPESEGKKSDHFVGDYYVRYAQWEKKDPSVEERARELLQAWEKGDSQVHELWLAMNRWAIEGIEKTYERTGISFDQVYYESETYTQGRDEILRGLEKGLFSRDEKGTVWVDLTDIGLDKKVLLRADGTSLYLTQDIGTAIQRQQDWSFDQLVYVVASEQRYHFQVLFEVLRRLGYPWAENLHHLAYGMVNLPEGKMKSREGTVVDADDLIDELASLALEEIRKKGRDEDQEDSLRRAEAIALGALHYYLLQTGPVKDMIFNPQESLAFTGNTGPYLQYVGARVSSMLRKEAAPPQVEPPRELVEEEWQLLHRIAGYPQVVAEAAQGFNPSLLAGYLYETAKTFSRFYHDHPIAVAEDPQVRTFRLGLSRSVMQVMQHGLGLLNIPFLEVM
ncbi:arginyl-tRNA synthetase [Alkalispirochaeta americana]|uniref:Arginine--tRNA ligase n=1 Tax=Alkalispirochaeta americana TaxID=159291 RepID=A0A1N6R197_9SPIO|nr:arginine--tRNA ligase [Alkalispirochaeta americana]SIQ22593.1 arginyl-tRNA synthetase [Alkalispirochaeta americana]